MIMIITVFIYNLTMKLKSTALVNNTTNDDRLTSKSKYCSGKYKYRDLEEIIHLSYCGGIKERFFHLV